MAIKDSTYVLAAPTNTHTVSIMNRDSFSYPTTHFDLNKPLWDGVSNPKWFDYYMCGWKGIIDYLQVPPLGMDIFVAGSVPPSAGLSSSSSVVCAAALATLAVHAGGKTFEVISKDQLAELCAKAEHYIGVEGGGMDQAIETLAEAGCAMRIDFKPLGFQKVNLPENALFAVLHSNALMNKGASSHYNERVVECRLAAQLMAKKHEITDWRGVRTLRQLATHLELEPREMEDVIKKEMKPVNDPYTRQELVKLLQITDAQLNEHSLNQNTIHLQTFYLTARASHVYSEAARVHEFQHACESGNLKLMGQLMKASHESLRDLYECSCAELDDVVSKCEAAGALGARLTGAGWGGCAVALVDKRKKKEVEEKLDVLFWSEPSAGLEITFLKK
ncbi:hypothetical protein L596_010155 [Steinernema carpocapsae]|uniref:Galactokinase n=1 Tax=Steinernema carpocapsae TaxID=34508 RepID=A0A4U5PIT3_STECR|nr:hypothetical protein L596_010155 [Steinernema carpocapsae]